MSPTEWQEAKTAGKNDPKPQRATLVRLGLVLAGAGLFLVACSAQTEDLIDRRINNATHVFNLD